MDTIRKVKSKDQICSQIVDQIHRLKSQIQVDISNHRLKSPEIEFVGQHGLQVTCAC